MSESHSLSKLRPELSSTVGAVLELLGGHVIGYVLCSNLVQSAKMTVWHYKSASFLAQGIVAFWRRAMPA